MPIVRPRGLAPVVADTIRITPIALDGALRQGGSRVYALQAPADRGRGAADPRRARLPGLVWLWRDEALRVPRHGLPHPLDGDVQARPRLWMQLQFSNVDLTRVLRVDNPGMHQPVTVLALRMEIWLDPQHRQRRSNGSTAWAVHEMFVVRRYSLHHNPLAMSPTWGFTGFLGHPRYPIVPVADMDKSDRWRVVWTKQGPPEPDSTGRPFGESVDEMGSAFQRMSDAMRQMRRSS